MSSCIDYSSSIAVIIFCAGEKKKGKKWDVEEEKKAGKNVVLQHKKCGVVKLVKKEVVFFVKKTALDF